MLMHFLYHVCYREESEEFVSDMWQLYNSINSTALELRMRESLQFIIPTVLKSLQEMYSLSFVDMFAT